MNSFEIKSPAKSSDAPLWQDKMTDSGLSALLSIRDFGFVQKRHYAKIAHIEKGLGEFNKNLLAEFAAHCSPNSLAEIKEAMSPIENAVLSITKTLNIVNEKIANKNRNDTSELWKQFRLNLDSLKKAILDLKGLGAANFPEAMQLSWGEKIDQFDAMFVSYIDSYARSCRIELQMIERYTPEEMNTITQIVLNKIPKDFNLEEAVEYEKDYLHALKDFKKEFSEEKTLWDKFLDILAGGTHQSPSEHVMMERWIEGEKGDLK